MENSSVKVAGVHTFSKESNEEILLKFENMTIQGCKIQYEDEYKIANTH